LLQSFANRSRAALWYPKPTKKPSIHIGFSAATGTKSVGVFTLLSRDDTPRFLRL
jgi:hypothetical protein